LSKPNIALELLAIAADMFKRLKARNLPPHPFPKQFSVELDQAEVDWAKCFVMVASTPRCGSTLLGHMLMQTGSCGVPLEYLHPDSAKYWSRRFGTTRLEKIFPKIVRARTTPNGTFSFKAHWSHLAPFCGQINSLTNGSGLKKIVWISRRNQLRQAISWVIADQTGVWISGAPKIREPWYDYDRIVEKAKICRDHNLAWRDYLQSVYPQSFMSIVYEDMLKSESVRQKLEEFLGVEQSLLPDKATRKQSDGINAKWSAQFTANVKESDQWILADPAWLE
jgi:LPS sulfotransferase NodH